MLSIVATPIGNLKDISLRALETLQSVDSIICEDTRRSGILLSHYNIKKPLIPLNDFNEAKQISHLINLLKSGQNFALISDAGTPLISDPGYKLVREATREGIEIDAFPGAVAAIDALVLSGLPPDKFFFLGYLPEKSGARIKLLESANEINNQIKTTFICYLAPFKLLKPLTEMLDLYGDIEITLAKELTKIHQTVRTEKISEILTRFKKTPPKGEFVVLFRLD